MWTEEVCVEDMKRYFYDYIVSTYEFNYVQN